MLLTYYSNIFHSFQSNNIPFAHSVRGVRTVSVCVCVCVCTVGTNGAHCFVVERSSHPSQTIPVGELHLKSRKTEEFRLTTMLH
jgi:hypothetical protein